MRTGTRIAMFTALLFPLACSTDPLAVGDGSDEAFHDGTPIEAAALASALPAGYDRDIIDVPGFGGLWFDRACNLHVILTEGADVEQAKRALTPLLRRRLAASRRCPDDAQIIVHRGAYTWIQLVRWLHELRPASGIHGVLGLALDVPANRIVIHVTGRPAAQAVLELLHRLGIPAEAVTFRVTAGVRDRR
jgi:hypothetical protein